MPDKIRWGIISTARIARNAVIPAIQHSRNGIVAAVGSRDLAKARAYADDLHIEKAYGSYEELLADPNIDAIYNPLPNDGHLPWSIAAAKAGKPTLVEKPVALNAQQAQAMVDAFRSANVLLAEAFMYRYHPQHQKVRDLLAAGVTGPISLIDACFTFALRPDDVNNVRLKPELGGGGLMDVGCYCVNLCRFITGEEPDVVTGQAVIGKTSGVDEAFVGTLHFPGGTMAHFDCGVRTTFRNTYTLKGPQGAITVDKAFRPADGGPAIIRVDRANQDTEIIEIPPCDQYQLMVEDFGDAVMRGRKVTYDPADSVKNMRVLDALAQAAREQRFVKL
ncbi:MAG: Gfo/Idh/MocA family oxidoreductase [Anaerolineae bacterium]|nr:Gfo/Idh/MocA family oxidoreductase [Anaerolineae bacterium]